MNESSFGSTNGKSFRFYLLGPPGLVHVERTKIRKQKILNLRRIYHFGPQTIS
ncbi:hypothetical protein LEP1GSC168_4090 [Leptospira santarosai str. HAI134]|nr:hypothetical protein LEP1GSC168_4090 [Leptospira santarosai str. HAI134]